MEKTVGIAFSENLYHDDASLKFDNEYRDGSVSKNGIIGIGNGLAN